MKAEFCEINVSALADGHELKRALEKAREKDAKALLVMIDECGAMLDGQHIYAALLAPLWSASKTKKIAFVLVDSDPAASNVDDFALRISKERKGPDLVSRINGPRITLEAPEKIDRAVLVASLIRRTHEHAAFAIDSAALRALVEDPDGPNERWSPRAVEYVIEALSPSGSTIKYGDLFRERDLCERMHIRLDRSVARSTRIAIKDAPKEK